MGKLDKSFLMIDKRTIGILAGDPASMLWFAALKDYSKRFKPDKTGFIRISFKIVESDYGLNKRQIRYLNDKLIAAKLIKTDTKIRGGRIPTGYIIY